MYTALKLSDSRIDPTKSGFETEDLAWDYIESHRCSLCQADNNIDGVFACDAEWMVITDEEYLK